MNAPPTVTTIELVPTPAVVTRRRARRSDLTQTIGSGISKVRTAVTAARVPSAGAPFVRFLSRADEPELEIGLPLDGAHAVPTLRATILPGGTAVSMWHEGSYEELLSALSELEAWMGENAEPGGDPWVWHWTEPGIDVVRAQAVWPVRLP